MVAALTIPTLMTKITDTKYKMAYKKAYADVNQAYRKPILEGEFIRTEPMHKEATDQEVEVLKSAFKVIKECTPAKLNECWADGEKYNTNFPSTSYSPSFIDASGRSWAWYFDQESTFFVDTNGFSLPNKFGKDRFIFRPKDKYGNITKDGSKYASVEPSYGDTFVVNAACHYPPCYFKSWLK